MQFGAGPAVQRLRQRDVPPYYREGIGAEQVCELGKDVVSAAHQMQRGVHGSRTTVFECAAHEPAVIPHDRIVAEDVPAQMYLICQSNEVRAGAERCRAPRAKALADDDGDFGTIHYRSTVGEQLPENDLVLTGTTEVQGEAHLRHDGAAEHHAGCSKRT